MVAFCQLCIIKEIDDDGLNVLKVVASIDTLPCAYVCTYNFKTESV